MFAVKSPEDPVRPVARAAMPLAGAAALAFAVEAGVAAAFPADIADHSAGAGRVSEAVAGMAFLLAAGALLACARALTSSGRWLCVPAVLGCAAVGVAQVDIAVRGEEWPDAVTTVIVLAAFVGLALLGVVGAGARLWPWWVASVLTAVVPVLFVVPSPGNSVVLAVMWAGVALTLRRR